MFNKLEIARLLLERGANTMLTNFIGQTALQLARESNNKAMIALIEGFNQQKMSE